MTTTRTTPTTWPARLHRDDAAPRALPVLLALLSAGIAAASVLGPLATDVMVYRTSDTTLNQLLGSDAAALFVAAPTALLAAWLVRRGRTVGDLLATGVSVYALYTYAQVVIGQEYLRADGNVERFFPLFLCVFVAAEAALVLAWRRLPQEVPAVSDRVRRVAGVLLLAVAAFLVVGLHLPTAVVAWTDPTSLTEYASSPTPFWMVKLMDLGIVVPSAAAVGLGLLHGSGWALRAVYPLLTGYTLLAWSVAGMALVMLSADDPDASLGLAAGFMGFAAALTVVTAALYRPLRTTSSPTAVNGRATQGRR